MFLSLLRQFVSAGRARPPHGTVRIGVEKVPAQQIVYLRFNLQLRWSGHTAALYRRGDWRREWNVYTSFIINRPLWYKNCSVYLDDASLMWLSCVVLDRFKQNTTKCPQSQHLLSKSHQTQQSVWKHTTTLNKVCENTKPHPLRHNIVASNTTQQRALSVVLCQRASCFVFKDTNTGVKSTFCISGNIFICVVIEDTLLCWVTSFVFYSTSRYVWRWVAVLCFKALCITNAKSLCFCSHWE